MTQISFHVNQICSKSENSDRWNWLQVLQIRYKIKICIGIWDIIETFILRISVSNLTDLSLINYALLTMQDWPHAFSCPSFVPLSCPVMAPQRPCFSIYSTYPFHRTLPFPFPVGLQCWTNLSSLWLPLISFGTDSLISFEPLVSPYLFVSFITSTISPQVQRLTTMPWFSHLFLLHPIFATMARSEECLHCVDLQAKLEQIRVHQKLLDANIDSQNRIINEKYEVDINLFLHRVSSLHE